VRKACEPPASFPKQQERGKDARNFKEFSQNPLPKPRKYGIIMLYARTSLVSDIVFIFYGGTYK
jgi:hypothetical protein